MFSIVLGISILFMYPIYLRKARVYTFYGFEITLVQHPKPGIRYIISGQYSSASRSHDRAG